MTNPLHDWDVSTERAREIQRELRERLVLRPPRGFAPKLVAGADQAIEAGRGRGCAGLVVIDAKTLATVEESSAVVDVAFPYVPGLLSFRELPSIAAAWKGLAHKPDAIVFDAHGIAHPRRFGLACHGGLLFDRPSVGCAKTLLVGKHGPLGAARGSVAELVYGGDVVGAAVRTRANVAPVYVSPGHLMDLPTAIELVLRLCTRYRLPETTRRAHNLVNGCYRRLRDGGTL